MMMTKLLWITATVVALAGTARAEDAPDDGESVATPVAGPGVAAPVLHAPPIADVLGAAYRAAGIDRDPSRSWIRRARIAGLVPWVTVRAGRDTSWQEDEPAIDQRLAFELRATWRLDRLVFDGRELQVAAIEAARRRERRRLASRVIRTYFTWRRASDHRGQIGLANRADEAAAELDALTDGWFSEQLALPARTSERPTSGNRTR